LFNGRLLGFIHSGCGVGGCGACGYGKQCCSAPVQSPADLEHMPVLAPQEIKDAKPGTLNKMPTSAVPPAAGEQLPMPAKNQ
jgi:hypothetical protein